ncbi:MAG: aromatic acid exporter family protein [Hespellia sp.]|nr:aromatic acid exporter family protein [Hespellia sp.]
MKELKFNKILLQAVKIAIGSSLAIYIAEFFHLDFPTSAGSIALLTIVTTKWETVRLSFFRIITFVVTAVLALLLFQNAPIVWVVYGIFIFILVMMCESLGWQSAISVNALIGTHFLTEKDFSLAFIKNEFMLVLIGITIAILFNLFHLNRTHESKIIESMRYTENRLQMILGELAAYLSDRPMERNVWDDIIELEGQLGDFVKMAFDYQENTFHSHPGYYIDYFEMRTKQCNVLHNLHYEMKQIRKIPTQSKVIAEYIIYMMDYVIEINLPTEQLGRLEEIFEEMKHEPLPQSRQEFESRAMLYHILMDLEEFLVFKKRFAESMNEEQKKRYWGGTDKDEKKTGKDSLQNTKKLV